jgi:hypothetical protein
MFVIYLRFIRPEIFNVCDLPELYTKISNILRILVMYLSFIQRSETFYALDLPTIYTTTSNILFS